MTILSLPFINMMIVLFLPLEPSIHHDQELNTVPLNVSYNDNLKGHISKPANPHWDSPRK
jgi:hypothetical protein